ncbi:MAG: type II secretion system protein GspG [Lentisphaeria bacterium]|nr:type II secretion system protein GspG [Lentisphaeria bacterium]
MMRQKKIWRNLAAALMLAGIGCGSDAPPERIVRMPECELGASAAVRREFRSVPATWDGVSGMAEIFATPRSFTVWRADFVAASWDRAAAEATVLRKWHCRLSGGRGELPGSTVEVMPAYDRGPRGVRVRVTDKAAAEIFARENARPEVDLRRRTERAREEIMLLEEALEHFFTDNGVYPRALAELHVRFSERGNWNGPYLEKIPRDPWGAEYRYQCAPDGKRYELYSAGADGTEMVR